jgi:uncharacterized membrane protein
VITDFQTAEDGAAPTLMRRAAIVCVCVGIAFRFVGLGAKPVWHDETYSALAVAGSGVEELRAEVFDGRVHPVGELLVHQVPRPGTTVLDTVRMLARDDSKHTPIYFVTARLWVQTFGSSVATLRAFSALLGLLSLPLVFLLCRELFGRPLVGWIAIALFALSPLHWLYGQEAREYILWVDLTLLAGWLLLRARRAVAKPGSAVWFVGYAAAMTAAFYTHLLTVLVAVGHLVYVLIDARLRPSTMVLRTVAALVIVGLLFLPWAAVLWAHADQELAGTRWAAAPVDPAVWAAHVGAAYARPFFDLDSAHVLANDQAFGVVPLALALVCVILVLRRAPWDSRVFLVACAAVNTVPFFLADLVTGGVRTSVIRYQFPAAIMLQLCVAWALAEFLLSESRRSRTFAIGFLSLIMICGLVSRVEYGRSETWWSKHYGGYVVAAGHTINAESAPVVVSTDYDSTSLGKILSLAHELDDDVDMLVTVAPASPTLPADRDTAFAWRLSGELRQSLRDQGWRSVPEEAFRLERLVRP